MSAAEALPILSQIVVDEKADRRVATAESSFQFAGFEDEGDVEIGRGGGDGALERDFIATTDERVPVEVFGRFESDVAEAVLSFFERANELVLVGLGEDAGDPKDDRVAVTGVFGDCERVVLLFRAAEEASLRSSIDSVAVT